MNGNERSDRILRTFVAIPLPAEVRETLHAATQAMRRERALREVRWLPPDNYHLTLAFLGPMPASSVAGLCDTLSALARHAAPHLRLTRLEPFPTQRPHVVAAMVTGDDALDTLHQALREALTTLGVAVESRPLVPHITVARSRRSARGRRPLKPFEPVAVEAAWWGDTLSLYQSEAADGGVRYTALCTVELAVPEGVEAH